MIKLEIGLKFRQGAVRLCRVEDKTAVVVVAASYRSVSRRPCCRSNGLGFNGHSEEFRMRYLNWQELININCEQIISFWDQTELCFGERLWQTEPEKEKSSRKLSLWRRDGGQPDEVKMNNNNNSQLITVLKCRNSALPHPLATTFQCLDCNKKLNFE